MEKNLLEVIKKLANNEQLTAIEQRESDNVQKQASKNGLPINGQYCVESRSVIDNGLLATHTNTMILNGNQNVNRLIESVNYLSNIRSNIAQPFLTTNNIEWGYNTSNTNVMTTKKLTPHRLSVAIDLSLEYINANANLEDFKRTLTQEIYKKVFQTMFSDDVNTDAPSGLLNNLTAVTLTDLESIADMQNDIDKNTDTAIFIISPTAKKALNELNATNKVFESNKLLESDYICTNLLKDNYLLYIDLSKVVLSEFGILSITIDNYTKKKDGKVGLLIESYFDFDIVSGDFIKVGTFL